MKEKKKKKKRGGGGGDDEGVKENVLHNGFEGQISVRSKKMSFIMAMKDKSQ